MYLSKYPLSEVLKNSLVSKKQTVIASNTELFLIASRVSWSPSQMLYIQHFHFFVSLQSVVEPQPLSSYAQVLQEIVHSFENWTRSWPISEMLAQPETDEEMKHVSEIERSVDKTSLTHSLQASSCVSCVRVGWHLNCSGPCHSMAPSPLKLGTGLPTQGKLDMIKINK